MRTPFVTLGLTFSLVFGLGVLNWPGWGQASRDESNHDRDIDVKVAAILDTILKRGEGAAGGVKTSTWFPPTQEDIENIKRLGPAAIPALDRAFDGPRRPFHKFLIVTLLGRLGGAEIVPPLKRALRPDSRVSSGNMVRMAALAALLSAPDSLALPIIRGACHDSDPAVAERAGDLLVNYYRIDPCS